MVGGLITAGTEAARGWRERSEPVLASRRDFYGET
jgi:hypothetical protein